MSSIIIKNTEYPLITRRIFKYKTNIKKVYISRLGMRNCPLCGKPIQSYTLPVQVSAHQYIKTEGRACNSCDAFYTVSLNLFKELETIRIKNNSYILDCVFNVPYDSKMNSEIRNKYHNEMYMQVTMISLQDIRTYTIISDKRKAYKFRNILHYSDPVALTLLTSIEHFKSRYVNLDNKRFVIQIISKGEPARKRNNPNNKFINLDSRSSRTLYLKRGGGYYSCNEALIQMDGLVFSEKTSRYEILPISYDIDEDVYFVDRRVYHDFLQRYGYCKISIGGYYEKNSEGLNYRSILRELGYTVSQTENLSSKKRQQILAQAVEDNILSISDIVHYLEHFIRYNGAIPGNEIAKHKWEEDLRFIQTYRLRHDEAVLITHISKQL